MGPKISWYVKQGNDFLPETNYYMGTFSSKDEISFIVQIWNNRWGVADTGSLENAVVTLTFDTVEDSAILPYCKLSTEKEQLPLLLRGQTASAVIDKTLSGAKNDGSQDNKSNAENFITLYLTIDLSSGNFKSNDLKSLYINLTTLGDQG